jgi:hypothetical protein
MSSFRVRPQFTHTVESSLAATREQILQSLAREAPGFEVRAFPEFIAIHFAESERRYWSPRLFLNLGTTEAGATRIEGIYGPEMEIWSLFVYGYLATGLLGTFAGILGFAQRAVGSNPWGLWVLAAMLVVVALLYVGAQLGQKLGAWQTFQLHRACEAAVGRTIEVR